MRILYFLVLAIIYPFASMIVGFGFFAISNYFLYGEVRGQLDWLSTSIAILGAALSAFLFHKYIIKTIKSD